MTIEIHRTPLVVGDVEESWSNLSPQVIKKLQVMYDTVAVFVEETCGSNYRTYVRVRYIDYTESGENHGTLILQGVCFSDIHFSGVILYVWGSPPVVSLFLMSTVLSVEHLRRRASIDAPVFPLQYYAVNDTSCTSSLEAS